MKGEKSLGAIFIRKKQDTNKRYIQNLSNLERTQAQMNLPSRGLKFIPTPVTNESHIRTQFLNDFKAFARRMPHSFHVKSNGGPTIQLSVTLESYLKEVKTEIAAVKISKPKNNLPINERQALKELLSRAITLLLKRRIREAQLTRGLDSLRQERN